MSGKTATLMDLEGSEKRVDDSRPSNAMEGGR